MKPCSSASPNVFRLVPFGGDCHSMPFALCSNTIIFIILSSPKLSHASVLYLFARPIANQDLTLFAETSNAYL